MIAVRKFTSIEFHEVYWMITQPVLTTYKIIIKIKYAKFLNTSLYSGFLKLFLILSRQCNILQYSTVTALVYGILYWVSPHQADSH